MEFEEQQRLDKEIKRRLGEKVNGGPLPVDPSLGNGVSRRAKTMQIDYRAKARETIQRLKKQGKLR